MPPLNNLLGRRFGRLVVMKRAENGKDGRVRWLCKCDCGNEKIVIAKLLINGCTKSCGCLNSEKAAERAHNRAKHGEYKTRLYSIWTGIKDRCYRPKTIGYKNYGGKGIKMCEEWQSYISFRDWAIANGYSNELTIDRINNEKDYCPENCRWATMKQQRHNSSQNRFIVYNNETHTIDEWSEITGINYHTISSRLRRGWNVADTLTKPVQKQRRKEKNNA